MSQYVERGHRTFTSGSTLGRYLRVKLSSGNVVVAVAADKELGVTSRPVLTSGDPVDVLLCNAQGTTPMVANNAIAIGAIVYTAAAGKVSATSTSALAVGVALTASTADGDIIEVLRYAYEA